MPTVLIDKPARIYGEITRFDPTTRTVTGKFFANPRTRYDQWNIGFDSVSRAIPAFREFPSIKEMHRKDSAAGTGIDITADEVTRTAEVTAHIVDDQAWAKVEAGVYRGFSMGAIPRVTRGNDVQELEIFEISLVDRPADPDCTFTTVCRSVDINGPIEIEDETAPEPAVETPEVPQEAEANRAAGVSVDAISGQTNPPTMGSGDVIESTDVPIRENLEGKPDRRKIRRVTRYAHSPGNECLHGSRDGAYDCMVENYDGAAMNRAAYMPGEMNYSFAAMVPSMQQQDASSDIDLLLSTFRDCLNDIVWSSLDDDQKAEAMDEAFKELAEIGPGFLMDTYSDFGSDEVDRAAGMKPSMKGTVPTKKDDGNESPPKGYPEDKSEYADPENYKYPLDTEARVRSAISYWGKAKDRSGYSASEQRHIAGRIRAAAKKFGISMSKQDVAARSAAPEEVEITRAAQAGVSLEIIERFAGIELEKTQAIARAAVLEARVVELEALADPRAIAPKRFAPAPERELARAANLNGELADAPDYSSRLREIEHQAKNERNPYKRNLLIEEAMRINQAAQGK